MFFMQVERNQGVVYMVLREYTVRLKFTTFITVIFCLINQVLFSGVVPKSLDIQIFQIVVSKFPKIKLFFPK